VSPWALTLTELTVRYAEGGGPSLAMPSARFEPNRVTVVVGANGTGKSTLCAVLLGWLTPSAGTVTADGLPAGLSWSQARTRVIGWIPTAPMLASGSVRENVALGRQPLTEAAWGRLARRAGLEVVLQRLAQGWETPLGDGGAGLSSGEQRRVALARALYDDPPVLLFDEPEASLDDVGVAALAAQLAELKGGRTIIVMTHDDRLMAIADTVVRLARPASGPKG
jgi:ATP-binding cassette subfamily C protein CydD